jgi:hypothetical protein
MVKQLPHLGMAKLGLISPNLACTSGCNYSLRTPGDGCGRHPKHVE